MTLLHYCEIQKYTFDYTFSYLTFALHFWQLNLFFMHFSFSTNVFYTSVERLLTSTCKQKSEICSIFIRQKNLSCSTAATPVITAS